MEYDWNAEDGSRNSEFGMRNAELNGFEELGDSAIDSNIEWISACIQLLLIILILFQAIS